MRGKSGQSAERGAQRQEVQARSRGKLVSTRYSIEVSWLERSSSINCSGKGFFALVALERAALEIVLEFFFSTLPRKVRELT